MHWELRVLATGPPENPPKDLFEADGHVIYLFNRQTFGEHLLYPREYVLGTVMLLSLGQYLKRGPSRASLGDDLLCVARHPT